MLGQEEEARRAGSASRLRSFVDKLLEDSREKKEIQVINHADGESGGADPLAPSDGGEKHAPCREAQEEEDPAGKESASKGKGRRHSGRSSPGGLGPSERRAGKRRSRRRASNSESEEEPQAEVAEVARGHPTLDRQDASPGRSEHRPLGTHPQRDRTPQLGRWRQN